MAPWGWGWGYGNMLGMIAAPPEVVKQETKPDTPLQKYVDSDEDSDEPDLPPSSAQERRNREAVSRTQARPIVEPEHGLAPSNYEKARQLDEESKSRGNLILATSLVDPTPLSTIAGAANLIHGATTVRTAANEAFAKDRGIGGEIPGNKPIGFWEDIMKWDRAFGSPFEIHTDRAVDMNRFVDRWAPELQSYQGDVNPQVSPISHPNSMQWGGPTSQAQISPERAGGGLTAPGSGGYSYGFNDEYDDNYGA